MVQKAVSSAAILEDFEDADLDEIQRFIRCSEKFRIAVAVKFATVVISFWQLPRSVSERDRFASCVIFYGDITLLSRGHVLIHNYA